MFGLVSESAQKAAFPRAQARHSTRTDGKCDIDTNCFAMRGGLSAKGGRKLARCCGFGVCRAAGF